jgi:prevent-host-death family protein
MDIRDHDVVTATAFSDHTAEYLNRVGFKGSELTILRYGKPFVRLVPVKDAEKNREEDE